MFRPRKSPSPHYGISSPYNPVSGEHAPLREWGDFPYCAMMQVAAPDSYADYVMCRGYDTRRKKFVDYESGDANKPGIRVAKPYGRRVRCLYQVGQVYPAFLPLSRIGQNPGIIKPGSDDCFGHPLNLTDETLTDEDTHLTDYTGMYINWMLIDSGPVFLWAKLSQDLYACSNALASILIADDSGEWCDPCGYTIISVTDRHGIINGSALLDTSGLFPRILAGSHVLVMQVMDPSEVIDESASSPSSPSMTPSVCQWAVVAIGDGECCDGADEESPSVASASASSPSSPSLSSSKSPAIVPASWTEDGYTALFTMESPGVEFTDVINVVIPHRNKEITIDHRFIEVCEPGSVVCTGAQPNLPTFVGTEVIGNMVFIEFADQSDSEVRLIISLRGTRRGFKDVRFPNRTEEQFKANEQFLKSAYPGA